MGLFAGTPFDRPAVCEHCDRPEVECICPPPPRQVVPPEKQTLRLAIEKRKKGKMVTVIRDLAPEPDVQAELLTRLKTLCGAGGTLREGTLEIQGEHLPRVREALTKLGYRIRG